MGLIPGSGRSPKEGNGNPLQCSWPGESYEKRSLVGYSPWGPERVWHDLVTKATKFKQHEIATETTEKKNLLMKFQEKLCVKKEHLSWCLKMAMKLFLILWMENFACRISKQRMLWPIGVQPLPRTPHNCEPWGTQYGDRWAVHCQALSYASTPKSAPWRHSGWKRIGYWP